VKVFSVDISRRRISLDLVRVLWCSTVYKYTYIYFFLEKQNLCEKYFRIPQYEPKEGNKDLEQNYRSDCMKTELPSLLTICFHGRSLFCRSGLEPHCLPTTSRSTVNTAVAGVWSIIVGFQTIRKLEHF
jgi:hypothetical protein